MLDQNDIQIIKELLNEQEARLSEKIDAARQSAVKEAVQESTRYMDMLYETKILPQFKILAEGHETLLETLAPKSRVDAIEEELAFLTTDSLGYPDFLNVNRSTSKERIAE